jgi:hypothetical protein
MTENSPTWSDREGLSLSFQEDYLCELTRPPGLLQSQRFQKEASLKSSVSSEKLPQSAQLESAVSECHYCVCETANASGLRVQFAMCNVKKKIEIQMRIVRIQSQYGTMGLAAQGQRRRGYKNDRTRAKGAGMNRTHKGAGQRRSEAQIKQWKRRTSPPRKPKKRD